MQRGLAFTTEDQKWKWYSLLAFSLACAPKVVILALVIVYLSHHSVFCQFSLQSDRDQTQGLRHIRPDIGALPITSLILLLVLFYVLFGRLFLFILFFGHTLWSQVLLLALHVGITPGIAWETIQNAVDWTSSWLHARQALNLLTYHRLSFECRNPLKFCHKLVAILSFILFYLTIFWIAIKT